ncbi:MAG: hypothetical protein OIN89_06145, partial [Candidatus Methanoperedens sp.]
TQQQYQSYTNNIFIFYHYFPSGFLINTIFISYSQYRRINACDKSRSIRTDYLNNLCDKPGTHAKKTTKTQAGIPALQEI